MSMTTSAGSEPGGQVSGQAQRSPGTVPQRSGQVQRYNVLPLDDRSVERFDAAIAGRPDLMAGRKSLTLFDGMPPLSLNTFINVKNTSHTITAQVEVPDGAEGVIVCQGGRFDGWSLYLKRGKPGSGGKGTIFVNGKKAAEGRIEKTMANKISETSEAGEDDGTPVTDDYKERDNNFSGKIEKVTIELK
jgi:hypothetical protein